jgi:hypothetical protein
MPGDLASAIDIYHLSAIGWSLGILRSLSSGVGALMLKQDNGVWPQARNYLLVNLPL